MRRQHATGGWDGGGNVSISCHLAQRHATAVHNSRSCCHGGQHRVSMPPWRPAWCRTGSPDTPT